MPAEKLYLASRRRRPLGQRSVPAHRRGELRNPELLRHPAPEGFSFEGYDTQTTDKADIVPKVKESFGHIRGAIEKLSADQSEEGVKMFGQDMTMRQAVWASLEHLSEHLGQSIAYARVHKVVPPWSQTEE